MVQSANRRLVTEAALTTKMLEKANVAHSHVPGDITGFEAAVIEIAGDNPGSGGANNILVLTSGTAIPIGTPAGTIVFWTDAPAAPGTDFVASASTAPEATHISTLPTNRVVGDVLVLVQANSGVSTNQTVLSPGWVEVLEFGGVRPTQSAVYIYQIVDAAALAALGSFVEVGHGDGANAVYATNVFRVAGLRLSSAWPAYASGSNRSAGTPRVTSTTQIGANTVGATTAPFDAILSYLAFSHPESPNAMGLTADPAGTTGFTKLGEVLSASAGGSGKKVYLSTWIKDVADGSTGALPAGPTFVYPTPISSGTTIEPAVVQLILPG